MLVLLLLIRYALLRSEYPTNIPSSDFGSNFSSESLVFKIKHFEPKTLKYEIFGFFYETIRME